MSSHRSSTKFSSYLVNDMIHLFDVPEPFILEYQRQQPALDWSKSNWDAFYQTLSPTNQMYVAYAMSTVKRGRDFYSQLERFGCIKAKNRYLDIGTAYAGYLRAFKEQGFNEVIGIEFQEHLAKLSRSIIDGLDNACLLVGDFMLDDFSSLGTFDLISCNDVIEHVTDASLAIRKMSSMVAHGGCLVLAAPNKDCISIVKSDGHFNLFGITQLSTDDAADYYAAVSEINSQYSGPAFIRAKKDEYHFEMGEMYSLDWYIENLMNHQLSVVVADINIIGTINDAPNLISDIQNEYEIWCENLAPKLNQELTKRITSAIDNYIHQLKRDLSLIRDDKSREVFENKYLNSCWDLLAFKDKSKLRNLSHSKLIRSIKQFIRKSKSFFRI